MYKIVSRKTACAALLICAAPAIVSAATFKTLVDFIGFNGAYPTATLVQGLDGNFYGTTFGGGNNTPLCTSNGGSSGCGILFKITPGGLVTNLFAFLGGAEGGNPAAGLVLGTDGSFYGTTEVGGTGTFCSDGCGTVFRFSPSGTLTTLHSFDGPGGFSPAAPLVQGTDGNFYGTTQGGGAATGCPINNCGTVFKITPAGTLTTLYSFCAQPNCADGASPAALVQGTDGNFYGTTYYGGLDCGAFGGCGTIFKITPDGTLTTLHKFAGNNEGVAPVAGLVQGTDGNFYGTTQAGGNSSSCLGVPSFGCGTVFRITPSGTLATLHSFNGTDGSFPLAGLVQGNNGTFYGTTAGDMCSSLAGSCGTLFSITTGGILTTLHTFNGTDGAGPEAGLVQGTDGSFYGTTFYAGTENKGTVFNLSLGLLPFVKTMPPSGRVKTPVQVLGTNLTGATTVTFNGTSASFTVVSPSQISTAVPAGATTGKVKVTTPIRTLSSNVNFRVTPIIQSFSPTSGPVRTVVTINGQSLTGATSVTFGGVKATSFTVNSDTQITATVPTGAKTGIIGATTPGGTALSTGTFTVD